MKTTQEILNPYKSEMFDCNMDECFGYYESEVLKAMEEYASIKLAESKKSDIKELNAIFSQDSFIGNVCMSFRHDFCLLSEKERNMLIFQCKEWMRAIINNLPYHKSSSESEKDAIFCQYCGKEKSFIVQTDINSGRCCKNRLCVNFKK